MSRSTVRRLLSALSLALLWTPQTRATTIDLLIVYDRTAASWVAANGGMNLFAEELVNRSNLAFRNSGLDLRLRLVRAMTIDYDYRGFYTDLSLLQSGQGPLAAVHRARDSDGADLVAMLVDTGSAQGIVGLGYVLTDWRGEPDYAFTLTAIRATADDYTLTHELGHNLGADHSRYQRSDPGPNAYLNRAYAAGWYFTGTDGYAYHSLMAYNFDGYGGTYTPAPLFSTPRVTYRGVPAGHVRDGDNTRLIDETKDIIAAYRASTQPEPDLGPNAERDHRWRVTELYIATLSQAPDAQGLDYWVDRIETDPAWEPLTVAQSFFDQALVRAAYPATLSDSLFIDTLYWNLFDRAPDMVGYRYWLEQLQTGALQRDQMIIALIEAGWANPEAENDMARFGHRVEVALAFAEYQRVNGLLYDRLSPTDQARLRAAGAQVLENVTADPATRDAAIDTIPALLDVL